MEKTPSRIVSLEPNQFLTRIGENTHTVTLLDETRVQVGDRSYSFSIVQTGHRSFSFLIGEEVYEVGIDDPIHNREQEMVSISINGIPFEVEVNDHRSLIRRKLLQDRMHGSKAQTIKAPMPGKVVRIEVKPDDCVWPGTGLLVLEAMKMENEIKSSTSGIVEKIFVDPGRAVEKGELLVSIKPG